MARGRSSNVIRVGVVGVGRGYWAFAREAKEKLGLKLVALCDIRDDALAKAGKELGVATYTDYGKFLEHDMDAVILANYFPDHAPFAIRALEAGKHVMSEVSACFTLGQGAALCDAVEKSGRIYMFAENCCYMLHAQEMRRIFQSGALGEFVYGEGEYVHPDSADFWNSISQGQYHWRNWLPATYYCTHSLGPLMYITDTWPVKVNACAMPYRADDPVAARRPVRNDAASVITVRMNTGAVVKIIQYFLRGHGLWFRVHGSLGAVENLREGDSNRIRLRQEGYHGKPAKPLDKIYLPRWPAAFRRGATAAGHGGGDFFMNYYFAQAIRTGTQPYLDVYRGVAMSMVGIQGWRSALDDSNTVEVPDFRNKAVRRKYLADNWNPDPAQHKAGMPWPSVLGDVKPTKAQMAYAKKVWKKHGYLGT